MASIAISPLASYYHYDVILIMTSFARLTPTALAARVLIMTSFATELATPSVTDVRYVRTPYRV